MDTFPVIEIHGTHHQIGLRHGQLLKDRIRKVITFYHTIFGRSEEKIFSRAMTFENKIANLNPGYIEEMKGIAEGAEVDYRQILALNARSEILTLFVSECTAISSPATGLLGQNWDWAEELEQLTVVMKISYPNGHQILMITEPGIIGKIGFNSAGLGVTLNFLHAPGQLQGVPIHIMLRALLDSTDQTVGLQLVKKYYSGKGGNIIYSSASKSYNFEFANEEIFITEVTDHFVHTNHYLIDEELNTKPEKLASSLSRIAITQQNLTDSTTIDLERFKQLLADQTNTELPVCRPYVIDDEIGNVGTVCSIIMDLNQLILYYTPGNPFDHSYISIKL